MIGAYIPPSFSFSDPTSARARPDVSPEDVASFLVLERMAEGTGVDASDDELREVLQNIGGANVLSAVADRFEMSQRDVAESLRRVLRVGKITQLVSTPLTVNDSGAAAEKWQEDVPEYKFQIASISVDGAQEDARAELPEDEELLRWFQEDLSLPKQRGLYTNPRVVPEAVYLSLDDENFDRTALLEAFPLPEGTDPDTLARSYYDFNRTRRFMRTVEASAS